MPYLYWIRELGSFPEITVCLNKKITHAIAAMVGIPPNGGFLQLQAFSDRAFPFTVVILMVIMILLTAQIVLAVKMKCLAKWVTAIHQSCELQAMPRPVTIITRQDQVGNSRWLLGEPLLSPDQELLAKRVFAVPFLVLGLIQLAVCRWSEGKVLVAHNNTGFVMLEIILAVGRVTVNQVSWAGPAVVSPGVTKHFSELPCFSEQYICDATGQIFVEICLQL